MNLQTYCEFLTPMKPVDCVVSSCRHCRFYQGEGRRGGHCQQLGVPVQGQWQACSLAASPFPTTWPKLPAIAAWQPIESDPVIAASDSLSSTSEEILADTPSTIFPEFNEFEAPDILPIGVNSPRSTTRFLP